MRLKYKSKDMKVKFDTFTFKTSKSEICKKKYVAGLAFQITKKFVSFDG